MKKFFRKLTAATLAAIMAVLSVITVFADGWVIDSNTKTASKSIGGITYTAQGTGQVVQEQYFYLVQESTKITNALNDSLHTVASRNVSIIYVGWQIARSDTGDSFGTGGEVSNNNTNVATDEERVSIYAPIGKFAVFGAHTAYQNGSTIIAAYTTTYNY